MLGLAEVVVLAFEMEARADDWVHARPVASDTVMNDFMIAAGYGRDIQEEVPLARASGVVHRNGGRFLERAPNPREWRRLRIEHHEHSVAEDEGLVERALPRVAPDVFAELVLVVRVRAHLPHANAHAHGLIQGHFRELGLGCINTDRLLVQTKN